MQILRSKDCFMDVYDRCQETLSWHSVQSWYFPGDLCHGNLILNKGTCCVDCHDRLHCQTQMNCLVECITVRLHHWKLSYWVDLTMAVKVNPICYDSVINNSLDLEFNGWVQRVHKNIFQCFYTVKCSYGGVKSCHNDYNSSGLNADSGHGG